MEHGNSNNLQVNYFQNSAKIYWTDKKRLETVGKMNEVQTRYAIITEKLVPLMTSFLTFELHCFFFCKHDSCNLLRKDTTKTRHGIRREIMPSTLSKNYALTSHTHTANTTH